MWYNYCVFSCLNLYFLEHIIQKPILLRIGFIGPVVVYWVFIVKNANERNSMHDWEVKDLSQ